MRFCGNFYFNSRYCGFKTLSGLRLLQPFKLRFSVKKKCLWRENSLGPLERTASGYSARASQGFFFTTHQGSLYQLTSLADVRFHIVTSMYVRFRYTGKNQMRFAVFLAHFCAVLRFLDPLMPPSYKGENNHVLFSILCPRYSDQCENQWSNSSSS